jgi:hypothetical protein
MRRLARPHHRAICASPFRNKIQKIFSEFISDFLLTTRGDFVFYARLFYVVRATPADRNFSANFKSDVVDRCRYNKLTIVPLLARTKNEVVGGDVEF